MPLAEVIVPFPRVRAYETSVRTDLSAGIATEHTYRPALKTLVEALASGIVATNEPKHVAAGAPDFNVSRSTPHGPRTLGYIETKDVSTNLRDAERNEQLQRYRRGFSNLVLTDYLDFRWYRDGDLVDQASLGSWSGGTFTRQTGGHEAVEALLQAFLATNPSPVTSAQDLADRLARLARLIRDMLLQELVSGHATKMMTDLRDAFRQSLVPDLDNRRFADMFAQTMAYGLFAARVSHTGSTPFARSDAAHDLPKTNPFLRTFFQVVGGPLLDDEAIARYVTDITELLADTNVAAVLADFGKRTRREDPIVHFYETFLTAYDPELREKAGVYYTPWPVVQYIVSSIDELLQERFGLNEGLADTSRVAYGPNPEAQEESVPRVLILDPAAGTATFLYAVIDLIRDRFAAAGNSGMWQSFVRDELLPRIYGFEFLMAPYAVAHLKLGMQLSAMDLPPADRASLAYRFGPTDRLGIYLTNTLEPATPASAVLFARFIADEANAASHIKQDKPVMVVLGNPPYRGHSENRSDWISNLVGDYKKGVPGLDRPAQAKWLHDDYVKFLRFAEWRITKSGSGIVGFITNHAFLDNRTFRGMRRHLMESFTEIYVLNLHGNANRIERPPGGGRDENVFDVRQGVAITFLIRKDGASGPAQVNHQDLWGTREAKYEWLDSNSWQSTTWAPLEPQDPEYLFIPTSTDIEAEYAEYRSVPEIMSPMGDPAPGIVTTQDDFAIGWSAADMERRITQFVATTDEAQARGLWRLCSTNQWNYAMAKAELATGAWRSKMAPIVYRPFDDRYTVLDRHVAVHRRERVMRHMLGGRNLGLVTTQTVEAGEGFKHAFATRHLINHHSISSGEVNYLFPLYLYPSEAEVSGGLYSATDIAPNVSEDFLALIDERLGLRLSPAPASDPELVTPEGVFGYFYALLHSEGYRERYARPLRRMFPRIPLTGDLELFRSLASLGGDLVALHLGEAAPTSARATYPAAGTDVVDNGYPKYKPAGEMVGGAALAKGRIYINGATSGAQYFDGMSAEDLAYQIGRYQPLHDWLRDRRGRRLEAADLAHYSTLVAIVADSRRLVSLIDDAIVASGGWPLAGS